MNAAQIIGGSEPGKDFELQPSATDGISAIAFSPTADLVAVSSWDGQTRIYEVEVRAFTSSLTGRLKGAIQHEGPALCCVWSTDGSKCFAAGADRAIRCLDVPTGQQISIPNAHEAAITAMAFSATLNALLTGSLDRTAKWWDVRSSTAPIATIGLPERCYAVSIGKSNAVVGCAERQMCLVNLAQPTAIAKHFFSNLKWQTRCVAVYPNDEGYAIGSIEGRVSLNNFEGGTSPANQPFGRSAQPTGAEFSFKCQREEALVYAVNSISFHPIHGTFATAGSDGTFSFWDKESRQRLKSSAKFEAPISASAFSRNGQLFAYAVSYDWSKGVEGSRRDSKNSLYIMLVKDVDIKPRNTPATSLMNRRYK